MSKFKVGDKVKLKADSPVAAGQFSRDNTYIVSGAKDHSFSVEADDSGNRNGWIKSYFELVEEVNDTMNVSESARSANPAIEEYTKTITVRRIRPNTIIRYGLGRELRLSPNGRGGLTLKTWDSVLRTNNITLNHTELRTLAKQLTEIADVFQSLENKS